VSLDVYLTSVAEHTCTACGHVDQLGAGHTTTFEANITHNLGRMADAAGIYQALWRPEEIGATKAAHLIPLLTAGLALLKSDADRFRAFNPENGWGSYDGFVPWIERYLDACINNPTAVVRVHR
jgi:hypothetical protein